MVIYDFEVEKADGTRIPLREYQGKVLLVVNTASKCGFTPQYEGLQKLYEDYRDRGFEVLAFPCNQFGNQEPGSNEEIQTFCRTTYRVTFPVFAKVEVNGPNAHPLFEYLKKEAKGALGSEAIKWNFTKFLVDRNGRVVKRYAPQTSPESIREDIEACLGEAESVS
ncbi:glutathione peroxidase [Alicyclobacillus sendaiensis PA2]|uniref:Glutathione peroxidase n=1 Tax=Alicyclobacillus sendaiensis PA2 TaxID=3029425 RepID=A0ABT6XZY0_ALISE|nr:glutathione peroxidase [Alicyclobacillus sendaiensis]MDI9260641.1 glutathione peroxidase [Alicyclobacillus sendaiensis PA2]